MAYYTQVLHMHTTHTHTPNHILTIAWVDPNTVLQGTSKNTHNIIHYSTSYHYSPVVMADNGMLSYTSTTKHYYMM